MKLVATMKIKVPFNTELVSMTKVYLKAIQFAIDRGFEAKVSNRFKLHHMVYRELRQWLPSDFACEAIAKASENLKSTKFKTRPIMKSNPIRFNRNTFNFVFNRIRLATFKPKCRMNIDIYVPEYYWKYLDWRYQTLEVIVKNKQMFFYITFSREVEPSVSCGNEKRLGVDLGVNNLAVTSDGKVYSGHKTRIMQHQWLRRKLQRKGTKSAKRHLRKASGGQKRYMAHINHCISKEIATSADIIVLEDLKGIRKIKRGKRFNRWLHSWSFYQLQTFIEYKANLAGNRVIYVSPYMTSQTCSSCGKLGSRYFDSFFCSHCGLSLQSDFNASCNLRRHPTIMPIVSVSEAKGQSTLAADIRDN